MHGNMMAAEVTGGSVIMELGTAVSYLGERCCLERLRLLAIDVAHIRGVFGDVCLHRHRMSVRVCVRDGGGLGFLA